jgi:ADP-ribose pyrophosphatase YjhB (NUDIX family)
MPISPYIQQLRAIVGPRRLLLPSVSVHLFDADGRMLLVRQRDGGEWTTPGGLIEPDERPTDAAVRELWEETGFVLRPERLIGLYGGPECVVRYGNGDEAQYVISAVGGTIIGGSARPDGDETDAVSYWSERDARELPLAAWLRSMLDLVYAGARGETFAPPTWHPPEQPSP